MISTSAYDITGLYPTTFDHKQIIRLFEPSFYDVLLKPTIKSHRAHYIKDLSISVSQPQMKA